MKKIMLALALSLPVFAAIAQTTISIKSLYNAQHAGHAAIYKILNQANKDQKKYNFILELRPGGNGLIATRAIERSPATSLVLINAAYVQNVLDKKLNEKDYVPVASLGDACWFVMSNVGDERKGIESLKDLPGTVNLALGAPGIGSASHLLSLEISEKINRPVMFVSFRSAGEAAINVTGENGLQLTLVTPAQFVAFSEKNPRLQRLAIHCETRSASAPHVATTKQQGIISPYVFNTFLASTEMPKDRLKEIKEILNQAIVQVGQNQILALSDFDPPNFRNQPIDVYHNEKVQIMKNSLIKHQDRIKEGE